MIFWPSQRNKEAERASSAATMQSNSAPSKVTSSSIGLKEPLDLSHHVSRVTKQRKESSIKEFYKYFAIPGIGNLAGGMFHFRSVRSYIAVMHPADRVLPINVARHSLLDAETVDIG